MPIWKFILINIKPFKKILVFQMLAMSIWAIDLSLRPYLLKMIINIIDKKPKEEALAALTTPALLYILMSLLIFFTFRTLDYSSLKLNSPLKKQIGDTLMNQMMKHSQTLFNDQFPGALANKIKDVMSSVPDLLKLLVTSLYGNLIAVLVAIITLSTVHLYFASLFTLWIFVFLLGSFSFAKKGKLLSVEASHIRSLVIGQMVDILSNITTIRLFNGHLFESTKLKKSLNDYVIADQARDWYFLKLFAFQGFSFIFYQATCLIWLIQSFKADLVTAGDFVMILTINTAIVSSLWKVAEDISKYADYTGQISQGLQIVLSPVEIQDKKEAKPLKIQEGRIVFENVMFHYKDTGLLFENKSITIEPLQKVGLVGYSGSGKSTFVNLILRLYDVKSGRILIDSQDIREVTQASLYESIGMIPQDPTLFHRSLKENIQYGKANASDTELLNASKKAKVDSFIQTLPNGYDSLVGERGVKLSGGQRQRIAIARAILKNAPILILDEATSQLDSVTEEEIQESLLKLMEAKTTLVVAHRLSTLLHMDRILVFDQGKIIQDGTHQELLAKEGLYRTLWNAQVGGFLPASRVNR